MVYESPTRIKRIETIALDKISSMSGGSITPTGQQDTIFPPGTFSLVATKANEKQEQEQKWRQSD